MIPIDEWINEAGDAYKKSPHLLINGDNLSVMEKLKPLYGGQVDCIYIDPPYNNGETYKYYPDDIDHDKWMDYMEQAITHLREFLNPAHGSLWISIDDSEMAYLKVLCDKIFGRRNFVTTIVWQQRTSRENRTIFSNDHEYILVYTVNIDGFKAKRNLLPPTEAMSNSYQNPDNDPRGAWQSVTLNVQDGHAVPSQFYTIVAPNGKRHDPPQGRCWVYNEEKTKAKIANNEIWFGRDGNGVPRLKKFLKDATKGIVPQTLWTAEFAGTNAKAKKHLKQLGIYDKELFETPKPESLIRRILEIATNEGDTVMDVFAGSGATCSTAMKMKRNFIAVERNPKTFGYIIERMERVMGNEQGGVSDKEKIANCNDFFALLDTDEYTQLKKVI